MADCLLLLHHCRVCSHLIWSRATTGGSALPFVWPPPAANLRKQRAIWAMPRHYHDWCDWCHTSTHNTFHCRSKRSYCKNCDRNGHHTNNCYYFDEHGKPRVGDAPSDAPRGPLCDPRRASEDERLASGHGRWPVRQATDARDRSCEVFAPITTLEAPADIDSCQQTTRNGSYPCKH